MLNIRFSYDYAQKVIKTINKRNDANPEPVPCPAIKERYNRRYPM